MIAVHVSHLSMIGVNSSKSLDRSNVIILILESPAVCRRAYQASTLRPSPSTLQSTTRRRVSPCAPQSPSDRPWRYPRRASVSHRAERSARTSRGPSAPLVPSKAPLTLMFFLVFSLKANIWEFKFDLSISLWTLETSFSRGWVDISSIRFTSGESSSDVIR